MCVCVCERESERESERERENERENLITCPPSRESECRTCSLARCRLPSCPDEVVRLYVCNVSAHGQLGGARVHIALLVQLPPHSKHPCRLPLREIFPREAPYVLASSCDGVAWVLCLAAAPASFEHRDVLRNHRPATQRRNVLTQSMLNQSMFVPAPTQEHKRTCTSSSHAPAPARACSWASFLARA